MERSGSHTGFGVTPLYPVHIGGGTDGGSSGYYLDFDSGTGGVYGTTVRYDDRPVGLYVAAYTWSNYGYMHSSDRRTKENIREVPGGLALKQIRQIPCVYYDYIDKFKRGSQSTIGFIAQDVKEVLPMSVSLQKDIIPNEMRIIENPVWNELTDFSGNKTYKLTINDLEDVSGNIRYKFYVRKNGGAVEKEIVSLKNEPNAFIFDELWTDVFLFGKEVDDFHTIDKSKIFALNFSATQEIDRIQQSLTQRISNLEQEEKTKLAFAKAKISVLESENKELKARLTSIEARLDAAGI
jgi:hypothetical protein